MMLTEMCKTIKNYSIIPLKRQVVDETNYQKKSSRAWFCFLIKCNNLLKYFVKKRVLKSVLVQRKTIAKIS